MSKRYGCLTTMEEDFLDRVIDRINTEFGMVSFLEIGVFGGETVRGIVKRCRSIFIPVMAAGVDFAQYKPNPPPNCPYSFYEGDSMEVWRRITSQFNFLFVDGCHCVVHSSQDFLNYSQFVVLGGYILLHDTALPEGKDKQDEHPQNHSYAGKSNSTLGVREALKKLGLLDGHRIDFEFVEEIGSPDGLGGMMLYRRVLPYD